MRVELVDLAWLKPHEEVVPGRVDELVAQFRKYGRVDYAIVVDENSGTIIDGHHRHGALSRLGAKVAPAVLVDYESESIRVTTWREGEEAPTKAEIVAQARAGKLYPPKSTRHDFVRILDPIDVTLEELGVPAATAGKA